VSQCPKVKDMDPLSVALIVSVLSVSLIGTSLVVRLVNGQLSQLRQELSELRDKHNQLLRENEALRKEVSELREALSNTLNNQSNLEDRILVVERLVKEKIGVKEKARTRTTNGDKGDTNPYIVLKVLSLRNEGMSIRQIAKKLGISKSKVHRILKQAQGQAANL